MLAFLFNYDTVQTVIKEVDDMKPKQVVEYFGTQEKTAKALGMAQQSIAAWVKLGKVPKLRQYQIEKVTKGKLKCSE